MQVRYRLTYRNVKRYAQGTMWLSTPESNSSPEQERGSSRCIQSGCPTWIGVPDFLVSVSRDTVCPAPP
jgi:hypothetical protein